MGTIEALSGSSLILARAYGTDIPEIEVISRQVSGDPVKTCPAICLSMFQGKPAVALHSFSALYRWRIYAK